MYKIDLPFKCEMFSLYPFIHEHFHTGIFLIKIIYYYYYYYYYKIKIQWFIKQNEVSELILILINKHR